MKIPIFPSSGFSMAMLVYRSVTPLKIAPFLYTLGGLVITHDHLGPKVFGTVSIEHKEFRTLHLCSIHLLIIKHSWLETPHFSSRVHTSTQVGFIFHCQPRLVYQRVDSKSDRADSWTLWILKNSTKKLAPSQAH